MYIINYGQYDNPLEEAQKPIKPELSYSSYDGAG